MLAWPEGAGAVNETEDGLCWSLPGGAEIGDGETVRAAQPCCCEKQEGFDDPRFLRQIASYFGRHDSVDSKRIYMAGHGNGCIASMGVAALQPDLVAAVSCHAGTLVTDFSTTNPPVPLWQVHGTNDAVIPYNVLVVDENGELVIPSALETFRYMGNQNRCQNSTQELLPDGSGKLDTHFRCSGNGTEVKLLTLFRVGHAPYMDADDSNVTLDTTRLAWEFCSEYSLSEKPVFDPLPSRAPTTRRWTNRPTLAPTPPSGTTAVPATASSGGILILLLLQLYWYLL